MIPNLVLFSKSRITIQTNSITHIQKRHPYTNYEVPTMRITDVCSEVRMRGCWPWCWCSSWALRQMAALTHSTRLRWWRICKRDSTCITFFSFLFLFSAIFRMNATFNLFLRRHNQRSLQRYEFNSQRKHEYEHAFASDKRVHQMPA